MLRNSCHYGIGALEIVVELLLRRLARRYYSGKDERNNNGLCRPKQAKLNATTQS